MSDTYDGQEGSVLDLMPGEIPGMVFTEKLRKRAYQDIQESTLHSGPELERLTDAGSHQARVLLGQVSCGETLQFTEEGLVLNYDIFYKTIKLNEEENAQRATMIATALLGHSGSLTDDGR